MNLKLMAVLGSGILFIIISIVHWLVKRMVIARAKTTNEQIVHIIIPKKSLIASLLLFSCQIIIIVFILVEILLYIQDMGVGE